MGTEITPPTMTKAQARRLTNSIRVHVESAWSLLLEARDRGAWSALGYRSFEAYTADEFGMSRGNAYRLVAQGEVIQALGAAAPELSRARDSSPIVSARQAAQITKRPNAVDEIVAAVKAGADPSDAVKEVISRGQDQAEPNRQDVLQHQLREAVDQLVAVIGRALTRDVLLSTAKRLDDPIQRPAPTSGEAACAHPKAQQVFNGTFRKCGLCNAVVR